MTDKEYMELAIEKAKQGIENGQSPFGACIVKDDKVISCKHNDVWSATDITEHAEINAIRDACKKLNTIDLSECVLYTTCEPCPMCFSACYWARISKIVYGTCIEDAKKFGFNELTISCSEMKRLGNSQIELVGNFLYEDNLELFNIWVKKGDKKIY